MPGVLVYRVVGVVVWVAVAVPRERGGEGAEGGGGQEGGGFAEGWAVGWRGRVRWGMGPPMG